MSTKTSVINMLQLPGGCESQQVMLQVRFAEVNRRALQELGASTSSRLRPEATGRATTQQFPAPDFDDENDERAGVQRFPEPLLLQPEGRPRRRHQGAGAEGAVPVARRAEPDRLQRPGGELSRRRRISGARRAGRDGAGHDRVQGVRREAELQADDRRRRHPPESAAGGQLARLQQRHHARGLPHSGADHAAGRDRRRAARRAVVRDRRLC